MRTELFFRASTPVLNGKHFFSGMPISNYKCSFVNDEGVYIERCELTSDYEWYAPTLLATLASQMQYWNNFQMVNAVSELQNLIATTISNYTNDDLCKYVEFDDFDDYLTLLLIAYENVRNGAVVEDDLHYFNYFDDDDSDDYDL